MLKVLKVRCSKEVGNQLEIIDAVMKWGVCDHLEMMDAAKRSPINRH